MVRGKIILQGQGKVREFNLSPRLTFWRKATENRHYGTTDQYFFEILSVSVYGLAGGGHVFYYFGLIWSGKFYSYQGKVTKKSG